MQTFKDSKGREHTVDVHVPAMRRVKQRCDGLELLKVVTDQDTLKRISDPVFLVDVLTAIIAPKDEDDFAAAITGDAVESAQTALVLAIIDFSPGPRDELRRLWKEITDARDKARAAASAALDRDLPRVRKKIERQLGG